MDAKYRYSDSFSNPDFHAKCLSVYKTVEVQVVSANTEGDQGPAGSAVDVVAI